MLDVRTPEEYEAGHLDGARSAPGGQLVQETDAHMATWNARVVLVDDNGIRATMTASWLKQMGWNDVAVLVAGPGDGDWVTGPHRPRVLGLDGISPATIEPATLRERLGAGTAVVVDLDTSRSYAQAHILGAWFAIRSRLPVDLDKVPKSEAIVLTSPDGALARLAAAELAGNAGVAVMALAGGTDAWKAAGFRLESGSTNMASEPDDSCCRRASAARDARRRCASTSPGKSISSTIWQPTTTSASGLSSAEPSLPRRSGPRPSEMDKYFTCSCCGITQAGTE